MYFETIPVEWLKEKISIEAPGTNESMLAKLRAAHECFLPQMKAHDEIWSFSSDHELWQMHCGRAGYALVRDGVVVAAYVTVMN